MKSSNSVESHNKRNFNLDQQNEWRPTLNGHPKNDIQADHQVQQNTKKYEMGHLLYQKMRRANQVKSKQNSDLQTNSFNVFGSNSNYQLYHHI